MNPTIQNYTETVLHRHLEAAGLGVDAVMADYVDASVIITHSGTYRGLSEIRGFFTELLDRGFISALTMTRQEVVGEVAFILWDAPPWFRHATDTFVIRNGKILVQTFSAQLTTDPNRSVSKETWVRSNPVRPTPVVREKYP